MHLYFTRRCVHQGRYSSTKKAAVRCRWTDAMARTGCGQQVLMHIYMLSYYCITCAQHTGHHHCFLLPSQLAQFAHHTCQAHGLPPAGNPTDLEHGGLSIVARYYKLLCHTLCSRLDSRLNMGFRAPRTALTRTCATMRAASSPGHRWAWCTADVHRVYQWCCAAYTPDKKTPPAHHPPVHHAAVQ